MINLLLEWLRQNPVPATGSGAEWFWTWSWQAGALVAGVWLVLKVCRAKSPELRRQIWLFALASVAGLLIWTDLARRVPCPPGRPSVM